MAYKQWSWRKELEINTPAVLKGSTMYRERHQLTEVDHLTSVCLSKKERAAETKVPRR